MDYRQLIGRKAKTRSGRYLGKIVDVELELNTDDIVFIHVLPPLLQRLRFTRLVIHRDQILSIEKRVVIVDDTITQVPNTLKKLFSTQPSASSIE